MKKLAAITFTSMVLLLATAMVVGAADTVEIRGHIATGSDSWNAEDFAGFYYDIDDNIKTETLTTTVTDRKLLEPDGVVYETTAMQDNFDFDAWGDFLVIGFMAEKYFAGYVDMEGTDDVLFEESDDENVLADEQLLKILVDNDDEMTVTSGTPLKMEEGYELGIKSIDIDGNKVFLELSKDGAVVDSKVISPSKDGATMKDKTYYYKKDVGDSKDVVIVAAHFKNAFRGADQDLATIDGLWQLSDTVTDVSENTEYDKMTIQTVTSNSIMMNNEDNDITLSNDKDISLMEGVRIRTADPSSEEKAADPNVLRYYIYKEITEPGTYEIRGNVATGSATWNADTFAGFYYDIDDNIKTEELVATVTERKLLEPDGVVYTTTAMEDNFDYDAWGDFLVIGFLAEKYFAGYVDTPDSTDDVLFEESDDENVLADEQLLKILVDNDDEMTVTSGTPLKMEEGYELGIKSIDIDGNKVFLELSKDGAVVDSKVISPSKDGATMKDKTYYYKKDVGDSKDVVIVAAHFKNAFRGADQDLATIDGLWQLSDTATDVSENTEYDKMTIQTVTSNSIMMNNEDNDITLSNDKDISLMEGVRIKTADPSSEEKAADPNVLRWYIYKEVTIEGEGADAEPTAEAEAAAEEVAETPAVEETAAAAAAATAAAAEEAVEETTTAVEEEAHDAAAAVEEEVHDAAAAATNATEPATPGFESIFAITGLLAVAYLVLGKRE
jgi:S-layer protein (TIGR01567 family)